MIYRPVHEQREARESGQFGPFKRPSLLLVVAKNADLLSPTPIKSLASSQIPSLSFKRGILSFLFSAPLSETNKERRKMKFGPAEKCVRQNIQVKTPALESLGTAEGYETAFGEGTRINSGWNGSGKMPHPRFRANRLASAFRCEILAANTKWGQSRTTTVTPMEEHQFLAGLGGPTPGAERGWRPKNLEGLVGQQDRGIFLESSG